MKYLDSAIIAALLSSLTGFGGWLVGRRKSEAEAKSVELENVQTAVKIWRQAAEELSTQLKTYNTQLNHQREENILLRQEIHELRKENEHLQKELSALRKEIEALKKQNTKLVSKLRELSPDN